MKIEGYDILIQGNSTQALQTPFSFDLELIGMPYYQEGCIMLIDTYS
jgi:hypothetical protein